MQSATLLQKMAGCTRGWAELGGLPKPPRGRPGGISTVARSWISNSRVLVDGASICWALRCCCKACWSGGAFHQSLARGTGDAKIRLAGTFHVMCPYVSNPGPVTSVSRAPRRAQKKRHWKSQCPQPSSNSLNACPADVSLGSVLSTSAPADIWITVKC